MTTQISCTLMLAFAVSAFIAPTVQGQSEGNKADYQYFQGSSEQELGGQSYGSVKVAFDQNDGKNADYKYFPSGSEQDTGGQGFGSVNVDLDRNSGKNSDYDYFVTGTEQVLGEQVLGSPLGDEISYDEPRVTSEDFNYFGDDCEQCNRGGGWYFAGWLDQGFTGNLDSPANQFNGPNRYNDRSNDYQLSQLYASFGKEVDLCSDCWDLGGRVDFLFGSDYFFVQSAGLETRADGTRRLNGSGSRAGGTAAIYGLAIPQLYAEVLVPWGNGVQVKMGHFYSIMGYESSMAPDNFFYSRTYMKTYGEPQTHTGLLASTDLGPQVAVSAGFTRGWDNWEDINGQFSFLGKVAWTSVDQSRRISLAFHSGNEDIAGNNNRSLYSLVWEEQINSCWSYVLQHDYGWEESLVAVGPGPLVAANWYGITQYLYYDWDECLSFGLRAEWFNDRDNARIFGIPSRLTTTGGDYFSLTLGANWTPRENIIVRPEIRWDTSDARVFPGGAAPFDTFSNSDQTTIAVDLILSY